MKHLVIFFAHDPRDVSDEDFAHGLAHWVIMDTRTFSWTDKNLASLHNSRSTDGAGDPTFLFRRNYCQQCTGRGTQCHYCGQTGKKDTTGDPIYYSEGPRGRSSTVLVEYEDGWKRKIRKGYMTVSEAIAFIVTNFEVGGKEEAEVPKWVPHAPTANPFGDDLHSAMFSGSG